MGAEAIIDKIRKNAIEEAAAIKRQSEERTNAFISQILNEAAAEGAAIQEDSRGKALEIERRERLMAGLETRKNTLASRRDLVDKAFAEALNELTGLPDSRWAALIERLVLESAQTGYEALAVPEKDVSRYERPFAGGKPMLDRLNEALREKGMPGALTLSPKPAKIAGGVLLYGEKFDVNASFEMLVSLAREDCERDVYHILYS